MNRSYAGRVMANTSELDTRTSVSPDPAGNRAERRAWAKRTKSAMAKPLDVQDVARLFDVPASLLTDPAPDEVRTQQPLSDEARQAFTALAALERMAEDPDGLIADRRQRALDRLHGQETPECGHRRAGQTCTRPADHTRSEWSRRHAAACGTHLWED